MFDREQLRGMSESQKIDLLKRIASDDGPTEEEEEVCRLLAKDRKPAVRRLAIEGLWGASDPRHIQPLIAAARHDESTEVRASAASVLGTYIFHGLEQEVLPPYYFRVRNFLLELVRDEGNDPLVRRSALEAASFDGGEDVAELITWAYEDADRELNLSAIFSMGRNHYDRWAEPILWELSSEDRERRLEAINAARDGYMRRTTPALRNLAMDKEKEIRLAAIWALARTGGPGALEQLELCSQDADDDVRRAAADAVTEYKSFYSADTHNYWPDEDW